MTRRLQVYETPEITVTFDADVCIHSGVCLMALPGVFDVRRARWIRLEAAPASAVADAVAQCPSGALQCYRNVERNPAAKASLVRSILKNRVALERAAEGDRSTRARAIVTAIREAGGYRRVSLWDAAATPAELATSSAHSLTGRPGVPDDSGPEMAVPVIDPATRATVGTLVAEREPDGGFGVDDRALLEDCADGIVGLFT